MISPSVHTFGLHDYYNKCLLAEAHKDASWAVVSVPMYLNEAHAHMTALSNAQTPNYQLLGEFRAMRDHWLNQAGLRCDSIASLVLECAERPLSKILATFFMAAPKFEFPTLRLPVETHKGLSVKNGRFA